jgi:hypothetical protein
MSYRQTKKESSASTISIIVSPHLATMSFDNAFGDK